MAVRTAMAPLKTWDGATVYVDVGAGAGHPDDTLRVAARAAATEGLAEQVGFVMQQVGGTTAAACLGLPDTRQLTKWAMGKSTPKSTAMLQRVHLLFQVCYAITYGLAGANARAFLLTGSQDLEYEAPVNVIRGDVTEARIRVLAAVRASLE
jgi:hypothetical protein